ncbi:MAG: CAP domain-containing protein [Syntrophorhabdaceae bacterium]
MKLTYLRTSLRNPLGENIAKGWYLNDKEIVDGWMQSPGHRKNILNRDYTDIGVAIIKGTFDGIECMIGVQVFGKQAEVIAEYAR